MATGLWTPETDLASGENNYLLFTNSILPGTVVYVPADSMGLYCLLGTEVSPGRRDASTKEGLAQRHSGVQTQAQSF